MTTSEPTPATAEAVQPLEPPVQALTLVAPEERRALAILAKSVGVPLE